MQRRVHEEFLRSEPILHLPPEDASSFVIERIVIAMEMCHHLTEQEDYVEGATVVVALGGGVHGGRSDKRRNVRARQRKTQPELTWSRGSTINVYQPCVFSTTCVLLYGNKRQNIGSTAAAPFDKEKAINKNRQADHKTMTLFFDVSKMYTIDRDQTPNSI